MYSSNNFSRGSRRIPPSKRRRCRKLCGGGRGSGRSRLRRTRINRRSAADRKTWERYVLENRPCSGLYGRLSGTYCSQVATRTPAWERHPFRTDCQSTFQTRTMLPSPNKNTGLGAPSLRNCLSIKSLNLHNTPKSLQERRLESIRFQKNGFPKACKGILSKTYCSQVISSAATWRLRTFG